MFFDGGFFYVYNIPSEYRACDLRNFFSEYVESGKFLCFHFRHRPGLVFSDDKSTATRIGGSEILSAIKLRKRDKKTQCALVSLHSEESAHFIPKYAGLHWYESSTDKPMHEPCLILNIIGDETQNYEKFKPPSWMPQGNVGTPTSHFFQLIKTCQLESSVISKLKLNFSMYRKNRKYGAVPYTYDSDFSPLEGSSSYVPPRSGKGKALLNDDEFAEYTDIQLLIEKNISEPPVVGKVNEDNHSDDDNDEEEEEDKEEEEDAEEWDRFEALHDDPYHVNRGDKANLKYENKVELVWEKGGSGLVFHTDERTWRKMDVIKKAEFFDEPASFDWDIDVEPYDDPTRVGPGPTASGNWGSDRDTADLIDINRSRENIDVPNLYHDPKALFSYEVNTKGYGSAILERMGWKPGMRLGTSALKSNSGLLEPLTVEKNPSAKNRPGLGYYGIIQPKLPITKQTVKSVYIRTIFDSPQTVLSRSQLGSSSLLRRNDSNLDMKWLRKPLENSSKTCLHDTTYTPRNRTVILSPYMKLSKEGVTFVSGGILNPSSRPS